MRTRFGKLSDLDLASPEVQEKIILAEKKSLVQGMVIEALTDQIVRKLAEAGTVKPIANELLVGRYNDPKNGGKTSYVAFLDVTSTSEATTKLVHCLVQRFQVVPFIYDAQYRDFLTCGRSYQSSDFLVDMPEMDIPLQERVANRTGSSPDHTKAAKEVRDRDEQRGVYWGELRRIYRDHPQELERLLRTRLLKNSAFPGMTIIDIDRLFLFKGSPACLEIKHKYPTRKGTFGMNKGQAMVARLLAESGLKYYHLILVNPVWKRGQSPAYIFLDLEKRQRVAVLGRLIGKKDFSELDTRNAPKRTSLTGQAEQPFFDMPIDGFRIVGMLHEDLHTLAREVASWLEGGGKPASLSMLESLRIQ